MTLALTVVSLGLALILGLTLSSASISFLHRSGRGVSDVRVRAAADACVAELASLVVADGEFGIAGTPEETLQLFFQDSEAHLTFNSEIAESLDIPRSTSNRYGLEPATGPTGEIIPPHTVQAFCLGSSGDREVLFEVVLSAPEFPYVIASSGPIESSGALVVGSAESALEAEEDTLLATAIVSNGDVTIGGQAELYGDLTAAGRITLAESVTLRGETRPQSAALVMEDLDIAELRPEETVPLDTTFAPELTGSVHHNGPNLTISGGLTLDDAVLYVNGDARIIGGVRGKGAIVVNGSLTIEGSSSLAAEDQLALVVQNDLTITGTSRDSSFFQGLIYTEGDFYSEDVTLMGAFVANRHASPTEPGSRIKLRNTTLVYIEEYGRFDLETNAYLVWGNGNKEHSGGRETLYLVEVDEQDVHVIEEATVRNVTSFRGAEGEASDNNGGSGSDGHVTGRTTTDNAAIAEVVRARKAIVEDGKVVSEWIELTDQDSDDPEHDSSELMQVLQMVNPSVEFSEPTRSRHGTIGPSRPRPAPLTGYEAAPDSIYTAIARASFHQDLNEFLGESSRLRVASFREIDR